MHRLSKVRTRGAMHLVQSVASGPEQPSQVAWQGLQWVSLLGREFLGHSDTQMLFGETRLPAAQLTQSSSELPVQSAQLGSQMRQVSVSAS